MIEDLKDLISEKDILAFYEEYGGENVGAIINAAEVIGPDMMLRLGKAQANYIAEKKAVAMFLRIFKKRTDEEIEVAINGLEKATGAILEQQTKDFKEDIDEFLRSVHDDSADAGHEEEQPADSDEQKNR